MPPQRTSLSIPPGSHRRATPQDTRGGWWDMSLVRFSGGILQPLGGWKSLPGAVTDGPTRSILSWRDNDKVRWVAAGSLANIIVWDGANSTVMSPGDFVPGQAGGVLDGYGIGDYGRETYGTPRTLNAENFRIGPGDMVTLDNYGEDLLAMGSADGRLLRWSPVLPVTGALAAVPNAPPGRTFIVTDERAVAILGAGNDPRRIDWCSLELIEEWAATDTNTAGSLQLRTTGSGLSMRRIAQGVIVFCDDDVHLLSFVGTPFIYGLQRVGTGCGPIGADAMVGFSGRAVWMGAQSFWLFDGAVRPLPCDVAGYVFSDINPTLAPLTSGYHNGVFPEVTWQYGSKAAAASTPDSYISWNYADNIWTHGRLERSTGCEPGAFGLPLMGDASGQLYQHESGFTADGVARGALVFAETGDLQLGEGDALVYLDAIYPDLSRGERVQFHLKGRLEAAGPEDDFGVFTLDRADGVIDACLETRSLRVRIEGVQDGLWQLGRVRLALGQGAGR